jgi:hypothetical protein
MGLKMTLRNGFSQTVVMANIDAELKAWKAQNTVDQVIDRVYQKARKAYRKKYPKGRFPKYLDR